MFGSVCQYNSAMISQRGQTTVELLAIFSTVAFCIGLCAAVTRVCMPRTYSTVSNDAYYVARDVSWAVDGMTVEKAQAKARAQNRKLKRILAPRKLKAPRDPMAELNLALSGK